MAAGTDAGDGVDEQDLAGLEQGEDGAEPLRLRHVGEQVDRVLRGGGDLVRPQPLRRLAGLVL